MARKVVSHVRDSARPVSSCVAQMAFGVALVSVDDLSTS